MEAELRANLPGANIRLIEGKGGIFDVTCDGRLIFSKHKIEGQRFPGDGEITGKIKGTER